MSEWRWERKEKGTGSEGWYTVEGEPYSEWGSSPMGACLKMHVRPFFWRVSYKPAVNGCIKWLTATSNDTLSFLWRFPFFFFFALKFGIVKPYTMCCVKALEFRQNGVVSLDVVFWGTPQWDSKHFSGAQKRQTQGWDRCTQLGNGAPRWGWLCGSWVCLSIMSWMVMKLSGHNEVS